MNPRTLVGAAIAGGLIWASRQPGGVKGTWDRLKSAGNEMKSGEDFRTVARRFVRNEQPMYQDRSMTTPSV